MMRIFVGFFTNRRLYALLIICKLTQLIDVLTLNASTSAVSPLTERINHQIKCQSVCNTVKNQARVLFIILTGPVE